MHMLVEYDPAKAASNLKKHGVSLADAADVLLDPLAITIEDTSSLDEQRLVTIGLGSAGEILVVVYTEREERYRIISARRATSHERRTYET